MIRRIVFYIVCLLIVSGSVGLVYNHYAVENIDPVDVSTIDYDLSSAMDLSQFNTLIMDNPQTEYCVLFYNSTDINSQYMFNVTLTSILEKKNISSINNLLLVDIVSVDENAQQNLKSKYGFSSAPAFVCLKYFEATTQIIDAIQESGDTLLSEDTVTEWLVSHNLISAN